MLLYCFQCNTGQREFTTHCFQFNFNLTYRPNFFWFAVVCVGTCMCGLSFVWACVCGRSHICVCTYVCELSHICVGTCVCVCVLSYFYGHVCVCVCVCVPLGRGGWATAFSGWHKCVIWDRLTSRWCGHSEHACLIHPCLINICIYQGHTDTKWSLKIQVSPDELEMGLN